MISHSLQTCACVSLPTVAFCKSVIAMSDSEDAEDSTLVMLVTSCHLHKSKLHVLMIHDVVSDGDTLFARFRNF